MFGKCLYFMILCFYYKHTVLFLARTVLNISTHSFMFAWLCFRSVAPLTTNSNIVFNSFCFQPYMFRYNRRSIHDKMWTYILVRQRLNLAFIVPNWNKFEVYKTNDMQEICLIFFVERATGQVIKGVLWHQKLQDPKKIDILNHMIGYKQFWLDMIKNNKIALAFFFHL